jgi:hypothetical protein
MNEKKTISDLLTKPVSGFFMRSSPQAALDRLLPQPLDVKQFENNQHYRGDVLNSLLRERLRLRRVAVKAKPFTGAGSVIGAAAMFIFPIGTAIGGPVLVSSLAVERYNRARINTISQAIERVKEARHQIEAEAHNKSKDLKEHQVGKAKEVDGQKHQGNEQLPKVNVLQATIKQDKAKEQKLERNAQRAKLLTTIIGAAGAFALAAATGPVGWTIGGAAVVTAIGVETYNRFRVEKARVKVERVSALQGLVAKAKAAGPHHGPEKSHDGKDKAATHGHEAAPKEAKPADKPKDKHDDKAADKKTLAAEALIKKTLPKGTDVDFAKLKTDHAYREEITTALEKVKEKYEKRASRLKMITSPLAVVGAAVLVAATGPFGVVASGAAVATAIGGDMYARSKIVQVEHALVEMHTISNKAEAAERAAKSQASSVRGKELEHGLSKADNVKKAEDKSVSGASQEKVSPTDALGAKAHSKVSDLGLVPQANTPAATQLEQPQASSMGTIGKAGHAMVKDLGTKLKDSGVGLANGDAITTAAAPQVAETKQPHKPEAMLGG